MTRSTYYRKVIKVSEQIIRADSLNEAHFYQLQSSILAQLSPDEQQNFKPLHDIFSSYQRTLNHVILLERDFIKQVVKIDPPSGKILNKAETKANWTYWMGTQPAAYGSRGTGKAYELKNKLMAFYDLCIDSNKKWEVENTIVSHNYPIVPKELIEREKRVLSWEEHTFKGPLIANLAYLEGLQLDLCQTMEEELLRIGLKVQE